MSWQEDLEKAQAACLSSITAAKSYDELEKIEVEYLGRKGRITGTLRTISSFPPEERQEIGKQGNAAKNRIERKIETRKKELKGKETEVKLKADIIDFSLPGKKPLFGNKHIITKIIEEITEIFIGLGYQVAEGPEVETDYYNFTALNMPPHHPARSLWDTLYVKSEGEVDSKDKLLLRTHTSPVQIRVMKKMKPPIYIIIPGKVFRHEVTDATHLPMFFQIEGLVVDRDITFGDLKGTLEVLAREIYGKEKDVRFRPSFFPFTEPSAEVDVSCFCDGKGCNICKGSGWIEILGAGMVDPNVLVEVGYNPEKVSGFAFGMGIERIAMLKYGVNDIRLFFENDVRFLNQFYEI